MKSREKIKDILKNTYEKYLTVKIVSTFLICLNMINVLLGIVYLIIPISSIFWNFSGLVFLLTMFSNLFFVYFNDKKLNKSTKLGNRLNNLSYIFLLFVIFSMISMLLSNFLISVNYANDIISNLGLYSLIYLSYFGILIFGLTLVYLNMRNIENQDLWDKSKKTLILSRNNLLLRKGLKITLRLISFLFILIGIYLAIDTLFGIFFKDSISRSIGLFVTMWDLFFAFIIVSFTVIFIKLQDRIKHVKFYKATGSIGLILSIVLFIPLFLTPYSISNAEINFSEAFGNDWRAKIDSSSESYFLQTPFSITGYFLGTPPRNCLIDRDVLFYDNATEGIQLYFDVYMPLNKGVGLPGKNSTLIRIHGGGWSLGDKGMGNMMQMNKYFAAQGYIVFDIQYGMVGTPNIITPINVLNNSLTMDDMMRQIGNFTQYITNNNIYGANLNSVFISGGSAGGQLTVATALGISSGNYTNIFGTGLTIKGLIPFYPAIGYPENLGGDTVFINPDLLINETSPPCLIYQGTLDNLVHPSKSQLIKNTYSSNNNMKCAIIWLDLGGHTSDIYFTGYYNQIFLYYMERFMYLCLNDLI